jgi:general stress protein 26
METYENALRAMEALFGRDYQFALATVGENGPSVRFVDTLYTGGAFYVVSNAQSHKALEIANDPRVSLCARRLHTFSGRMENIGHPLLPQNAALRNALVAAFAPWYFRHNDENNKGMCILRFTPETGFFQADGLGWRVDFTNCTAECFPFVFDITLTEE